MALESVLNLMIKSETASDKYSKYIMLLEAIKQYLNLSYDPLLIMDTGVVATIPGSSITTDIVERQMAFNVPDMIGFINLNNEIVQWSLTGTANFTLTTVVITKANEQDTSNYIVINGTNFVEGMTVGLVAAGVTFTNVVVTYISSTRLGVTFDAAGNITQDTDVVATVTKGVYKTHVHFFLDADLTVMSSDVDFVGVSASENVTLVLNEAITTLTSVTSNNPRVIVVSTTLSIGGDEIDVELDTSGVLVEETFTLVVEGDGETSPAFPLAVQWPLVISNLEPITFGGNQAAVPFDITVNREPRAGYTLDSSLGTATVSNPVYAAGHITGTLETVMGIADASIILSEPAEIPALSEDFDVFEYSTCTDPVAKGASVSVTIESTESGDFADIASWTFTIEENADVTFIMAAIVANGIECSVNTSAAVGDLTFKIKATNGIGNTVFLTDVINITP